MKLILEEPDISARDLKTIKIPALVTAGERDIVRRSHTRTIAAALPCSELLIIQGETHDSYVVHSTKLVPALISFFK